MKLSPTILALTAPVNASTKADTFTYSVKRCFCADRHDIGFVNTYDLTLGSGHTYFGRDIETTPRGDNLIWGRRCSGSATALGSCVEVPDVRSYDYVFKRSFGTACTNGSDGKRVCFSLGGYRIDGVYVETLNRRDTDLIECDNDCKQHWSHERSTMSICSYNNLEKGAHYGELIPTKYIVQKGKIKPLMGAGAPCSLTEAGLSPW